MTHGRGGQTRNTARGRAAAAAAAWLCAGTAALMATGGGCVLDVADAPPPVAESECQTIVGPADNPNAIVFGAVLALSGTSTETARRALNSITQATEEINDFGGVGGKQDARPLAFIVCDDGGDADQAVAAASYLVYRKNVAAIIGTAQSRSTLAVAEQVTIPTGTLLISGSATSTAISDLDDNNLVWRTAPPDEAQPQALAFFAYWQLLERKANANVTSPTIALVYSDDSYGQGVSSDFETALSALINTGGEVSPTFTSIAYDPQDANAGATAGAELKALVPNVDLVLLAGFEEVGGIMEVVRDDDALRQLPYFMPDATRTSRLRTTFPPGQIPELLFGVNPGFRNSDAFETFRQAYLARYNVEPDAWAEHYYDATYLLAYALAGTDPGAISGGALAQVLTTIVEGDGTSIKVGPGDLTVAYGAAEQERNVDVLGASGPLDFDIAVGEPSSTGILRWNVNPENQTFSECGLAISFNSGQSDNLDWCNARCLPPGDACEPPNAP